MRCEESLQVVLARAAGERFAANEHAELEAHLARCSDCRREAEDLEQMWKDLGRLEEPAPSLAMQRRLDAAVMAFGLGPESPPTPRTGNSRAAGAWLGRPSLLPRPLLQLAYGIVALTIGVWIGGGASLGSGSGELAALRAELRSLEELVALSLLQQDAATARLRGVGFGEALVSDSRQVMEALLNVLENDPNPNVRLAAADTLAPAAADPRVQRLALSALSVDDSPLVQIALVDLLLSSGDPRAHRRVREVAARDETHEAVRRHIAQRIGAKA